MLRRGQWWLRFRVTDPLTGRQRDVWRGPWESEAEAQLARRTAVTDPAATITVVAWLDRWATHWCAELKGLQRESYATQPSSGML